MYTSGSERSFFTAQRKWMVPATAVTYTSWCSRAHRFPPSRRTHPRVDVIASGTRVSHASIPMVM